MHASSQRAILASHQAGHGQNSQETSSKQDETS